MQNTHKKVALIILDGWGKGTVAKADAIKAAKTPFIDNLYANYPNAELVTFGEQVGLPKGQMGNSEVGHLNIGAGRIVYQDFLRINNAIADGSFEQMNTLTQLVDIQQERGCNIHLMGLFSDGGVHSHLKHLKALTQLFNKHNCTNVFIHAFMDGRDTDPKNGVKYLADWLTDESLPDYPIASIIGRYYAMDRDNRWERIKLAYDLLLEGKGEQSTDLLASLNKSYADGVTDEFVKPIFNTKANATIKPNDIVLCFNFRTDRCRQITKALSQENLTEHGMQTLPLHYITMTQYDKDFKDVNIVFTDNDLTNTLGEVLAKNGKSQLRAAETEKYPHVTFFFSGGREEPFEGESRVMAASPKVATYDLQPEMSAYELAEKSCDFITKNQPDFVCLNFANPDMVGHTGVFDAVVKAVETTDQCCQKVTKTALENGYSVIVIADHGNADFMVNADGSPNTAHTKNPVPIFFVDGEFKPELKDGKLADLAPSILHLMGIEIPDEMDGEILFKDA